MLVCDLDEHLELLEIGPLYHARWITLASRILRLYVSEKFPSKNLSVLAEFCIKVYFPSWFEMKPRNTISDGAKHFHAILNRISKFPDRPVRDNALESLERNSFFAHPENILISMLSDTDYQVRCLAVNKILTIRGEQQGSALTPADCADDFASGLLCDNEGDPEGSEVSGENIRRFRRPKLNLNAKVYYKLVDMNSSTICEPPAIRHKSCLELNEIRHKPLTLMHPCHNQAVERHVKVVSEASAAVATFDRRDGLIRQKLKSRKLMKELNTKRDFFTTSNPA